MSAGGITVDGKRVMERVRSERDRFVGSVIRSVEKFPEEHRIMGHARFTGPNRLVIDNETEIHAQRIIIATGSRPNIPGFLKEAKDLQLFSLQAFFDRLSYLGIQLIGILAEHVVIQIELFQHHLGVEEVFLIHVHIDHLIRILGIFGQIVLNRINVMIRIDSAFTSQLNTSETDRNMVQSMVDMAHYMDREVIAGQVESRDVLDTLTQLGVDYAQGFVIEKPRSLDSLT